MLKDTLTLERMTPEDIATARECLLRLLANDIAVGPWSDETQVRQTGCTINVKWTNKVSVSLNMNEGAANEFVVLMLKSPDVLWSLLMKLFDVNDDDLEALKAEATSA